MVDTEHVRPAVDRQQVTALAVRVVHGRIERRDPPQARIVGHDHLDHVDGQIELDVLLDHALAERPVAQHGRRDDAPAERLGHVPRRHLAAGQRPVGEVVERPLAGGRLVDGVDRFGRLGIRAGDA